MSDFMVDGESIGSINAVVVTDHRVTFRCDGDNFTCKRENVNLGVTLQDLDPSVDVIQDD